MAAATVRQYAICGVAVRVESTPAHGGAVDVAATYERTADSPDSRFPRRAVRRLWHRAPGALVDGAFALVAELADRCGTAAPCSKEAVWTALAEVSARFGACGAAAATPGPDETVTVAAAIFVDVITAAGIPPYDLYRAHAPLLVAAVFVDVDGAAAPSFLKDCAEDHWADLARTVYRNLPTIYGDAHWPALHRAFDTLRYTATPVYAARSDGAIHASARPLPPAPAAKKPRRGHHPHPSASP